MPSPETASSSETTTPSSTYDLVLLLDSEAEQQARAGVLGDVERSISSDGELVRHDEWGERELAYPIRHRHHAEYHLLQFRPSEAELLRGLERSLRIADEVLRFRIVRLRPGTPAAPDMRAGQSSGSEHGAARAAAASATASQESDSASRAAPPPASDAGASAGREDTDAASAASAQAGTARSAQATSSDASAQGAKPAESETPGATNTESAPEDAADSEAPSGPAPDSA
jgi:small subunit ribosomal protein S6